MMVRMKTDRPTMPGRHVGLFARGRRHGDHRLASLLSSDSDTVLVLRGPVVTSASASARDLLGWEPSLCVGRSLSELLQGASDPNNGDETIDAVKVIDALQDAAEAAGGHIATHRDLALTHIDGQTVWVDATIADLRHDTDVSGTIVTFHDVTERRALEARLREAEFRDELTRLANRKMLRLIAEEAVKSQQHVALVMLDLAAFGPVNETHGSDVGDAVLVEVAARLSNALRAGDHVARVDGDEFALVVNGLDPDEPHVDAAEVADRVERALRPDFVVRTGEAAGAKSVHLKVQAHLAIVVHQREDSETAEAWMRRADRELNQTRRENMQPADR
jgi:diguanylate cyclase (GGDEF)-like protein